VYGSLMALYHFSTRASLGFLQPCGLFGCVGYTDGQVGLIIHIRLCAAACPRNLRNAGAGLRAESPRPAAPDLTFG